MPKLKDKRPDEPLDGRQETFCQLMSIGKLSASAAYRQAGYSHKQADSSSAQLHVKPHIKNRIAYLKAELAQKQGITRETQSIKLATVAEKCLENGEHSTYVRAIEAQNRLYGLDKQVIEQSSDSKPLTRTEQQDAEEWAEYQLWKASRRTQSAQADKADRGGSGVDEGSKDAQSATEGHVVPLREPA